MAMTNVKVKRKDVLSSNEIDEMFKAADRISNEYQRLRAKAIVSLFITGKRRQEVATLEKDNLKVEGDYLYVTFTVVKKRKKSIMATSRTKRFPLKSRYAQHIIEYKEWLEEKQPECKYFFPSVRNVFAMALSFSQDNHLTGRQILNIVKGLNPRAWCHLFRETRGAAVIKADEQKDKVSIFTVYKVKHALDLEKETTAWNYINRYATETIEDLEQLEEIQ